VPLEPSNMFDAENSSTRRSSGRFTGGISSGGAVVDAVTNGKLHTFKQPI
jgi:hypothetical protein